MMNFFAQVARYTSIIIVIFLTAILGWKIHQMDVMTTFLNGCDDLFLTGEEKMIAQCKREITSEFVMKDMGLMHYFLGLEVWQRPDEIFLSQGKYAVDILQRFGMQECKPMSTPMVSNLKKLHEIASCSKPVDPILYRQLIGSLM